MFTNSQEGSKRRRLDMPGTSRDSINPNMEGPAIAKRLGPPGETYKEEVDKLFGLLHENKNMIGPEAGVVYADYARKIYTLAKRVANNNALSAEEKFELLFQNFDLIVIAYKGLSLVECNDDGAKSIYGYSDGTLKAMLSRIEAMARDLAVGVHDAYSLAVINSVMSTAKQHLQEMNTEKNLEVLKYITGGGTESGASENQLPCGVEVYSDPYPNVADLLRRLYATNQNVDYLRDFHDALFLTATANAPAASLKSAIETRLADKDRTIVWFCAPGDRMFASAMCASAIGYLRQKLREGSGGTAVHDTETYRINYGHLFSKYRGESERNFDRMMEWIKDKVRGSDRFRIFWFPDIENLMSPRSGTDHEHIAAIKNSMLQHMDDFNKDRTLRSFMLLFHSAEGALDDAFSRRLTSRFTTPQDPLANRDVAKQAVGCELAHFHINATDRFAEEVARIAGTPSTSLQDGSVRVPGYAYVQATLREKYVEQKLMLSHGASSVDTNEMEAWLKDMYVDSINSRYDLLFGLDESNVLFKDVAAIAFSPASVLANQCPGARTIKYNAKLAGDVKNIVDKSKASRTLFLHDNTALVSTR